MSAHAGDPQAVERLLRYYDNYMNCLCTRTLYDEDGYPHLCVDEYMKRCLEIRLIQAIVEQYVSAAKDINLSSLLTLDEKLELYDLHEGKPDAYSASAQL